MTTNVTAPTPTKKTCLIVDDSRIVRKVTRRILETIGFACIEAENGADALDMCRAHKPEIVMLDWQMPKMSGIECLKDLRTMSASYHPKVIFCTTQNDYASIKKAIKLGADEYIMKPFDADILRSKLFFAGALSTAQASVM